MTNFGFGVITDLFNQETIVQPEFKHEGQLKSLGANTKVSYLSHFDTSIDDTTLDMMQAQKSINVIIQNDDIEALEYLKNFTDENYLQFLKSIPSSFFTKIIFYIRNIKSNERYGLLGLQIIGNIWREFDKDIDILLDQELVKLVFDVMTSGYDLEVEIASLVAISNLIRNCVDSVKCYLNEAAFERMKNIFIMAKESANTEALLMKIIEFYMSVLNSKEFDNKLFIPIIHLIEELLMKKIDGDLFSSCLHFIAALSENNECLAVIKSLNYFEKIILFLKDSHEAEKVGACYKILMNITPEKKILLRDDMIEILNNHIQQFQEVPVIEIYEYIQSLIIEYPDELFEIELYQFLLEFGYQVCYQNREYIAYCFCEYLIGGKNYNKKLNFLLSGSLSFICEVIPCLDNSFAIAKMLNYILQITKTFPNDASEVIKQTFLFDDLDSILNEEQANEDLITLFNLLKEYVQ